MPQLGSIPLTDPAHGLVSGGAFRLADPVRNTAILTIPSGAAVQVCAGTPYVAARLPSQDADDLFVKAFEAVETALDWWAVTGRHCLAASEPHAEHLLWWPLPTENGLAVKVVSEVALNCDVPPVRVLIDGKEQVDELLSRALAAHPGFRFFRLAQRTSDLHDAYRHLWLAFEITLSRQHPIRPGERETEWLRRAIGSCARELSLVNLVKVTESEVPHAIIKRLYSDVRLPLFHAKFGRDHDVPHSIGNRRTDISDAHQLLVGIIRKMFEKWHDARWTGGKVYSSWLCRNFRNQMANAVMVVSDHTELDPSESDLSHPRFRHGARVPAVKVTSDEQYPRVEATLVARHVPEFGCLSHVQCFEIVGDTHPLMAHTLEDRLTGLSEIARIELSLGFRVLNKRQPRQTFPQ